jgi:hypothetical protein
MGTCATGAIGGTIPGADVEASGWCSMYGVKRPGCCVGDKGIVFGLVPTALLLVLTQLPFHTKPKIGNFCVFGCLQ